MSEVIEIIPAILRPTFESIAQDWEKVRQAAAHIQIDITDGIFAGDGTWRDVRRFKQLPESGKVELHMMVHTPGNYIDDILDLNPARCIFHIESFAGSKDAKFCLEKIREQGSIEVALALNPSSPTAWLEEQTPYIHYVLFMGYNPGWANQPLNETVFNKIREWQQQYADMPIAVDGHVSKETIERYVQAGARRLCANTAIFGQGDPVENIKQLELIAASALT